MGPFMNSNHEYSDATTKINKLSLGTKITLNFEINYTNSIFKNTVLGKVIQPENVPNLLGNCF